MASALKSLTRRRSRAQPSRLRSSPAAVTKAWQVLQQAPCSRRPQRLLVHAARARASRRRAPRAAAHASASVSISASVAALDLCGMGCSHATGSVGVATRALARLADSTVLAFGRALRILSCAVPVCGKARRGWWRTNARTAHSCAAKRESAIPARRRAWGIGRAIDGVFCKDRSQTPTQNTNKQTNKQTSKQANNQTNNGTNTRNGAEPNKHRHTLQSNGLGKGGCGCSAKAEPVSAQATRQLRANTMPTYTRCNERCDCPSDSAP